MSPHDPHTVVGSIGERGLLRHAAQDAELLGAEIVDVMEAPFPAVAASDPVREAVELLVGDQQALLVTVDGRAAGLVTRADLLEALAVVKFGTRAVHAGLTPDPSYGSVIPAIHQTSTYAQPAPGEFVEDYDYSRSANPTRARAGDGAGRARGRPRRRVLLRPCRGARGDHADLRSGRARRAPDDLYGGTYRLVDKVLTRWGLEYDLVDQTDLDALERAVRPRDEARSGSRRRRTRC